MALWLLAQLLHRLRRRGGRGGASASGRPSVVAFGAARRFYGEGLAELGLLFEDVGSVLEEVEGLLDYAEYLLGPLATRPPSG